MKLTKVKVKKADVNMTRDTTQGYIEIQLNPPRKLGKVKEIENFIQKEKINNLLLSITNRIVKSELEQEVKTTLTNIFKEMINEQLGLKITPNISLKGLEKDKEKIKTYFKRLSKEHQIYIEEFYQALIAANDSQKLIQKLPTFKQWIQKKLAHYQFTERSIYHNKIALALSAEDTEIKEQSKRKSYLNKLLIKLVNSSTPLQTIKQEINALSQKYQLNELLTGLQQINAYSQKNEKSVFKEHLYREYKQYLQTKHQPIIFGSNKQALSADHVVNRSSESLYVLHNEVVDYLKKYFPHHSKATQKDYTNKKQLLEYDYVMGAIKQKIINKLTQQLILNGKAIHYEEIEGKITVQQTKDLQKIKTQETFKRKLTDEITFASNVLKNQLLNKVFSKEQITFIQNNLSIWKNNPNNTEITHYLQSLTTLLVQTNNSGFEILKQDLDALKNTPPSKERGERLSAYKNKLATINKYIRTYEEDIEKLKKEDFLGADHSDRIKKITTIQGQDAVLFCSQYGALYSLRNATFHLQELVPHQDTTTNGNPLINIIKNDIMQAKQALIQKLLSNNVLTYYSQTTLEQILDKPLSLGANSVAFAPSFDNVLKRADGLKHLWASNALKKWQQPQNYARYYLLNLCYYHYFLDEFLTNNQHFDQVRLKINNRALSESIKSYQQFADIPFENNIGKFLATIQAKEAERLKSQAKENTEEKRTKEQPYFQRYLQDIFAEGFKQFIENKLPLINTQTEPNLEFNTTGTDNLQKALQAYERIITLSIDIKQPQQNNPQQPIIEIKNKNAPKFTKVTIDHNLALWYGLISLLDAPHLNDLKGNLLKYTATGINDKLPFNTPIHELLILVNLRMYSLDITPEWQCDEDKQLKLLSLFLDIDNPTIEGIQCFEPNSPVTTKRQQLYLSNDKVILTRALHKIQQSQTIPIFDELIKQKAGKFKVTQDDCQQFYQQENTIADDTKQREELHQKWVKAKQNFNDQDKKNYLALITKEQKYIHLKNKVNLVYISRLNALLQDIWSHWISTVYLWERDVYYITLALQKLRNSLKLNDINTKRGKIEYVKQQRTGLNNIFSCFINNFEDKEKLRHHIAHYHYLRGNDLSKSILDHLKDLRFLVNHDRKLKNAVAKSFIDLLDKHGITITFKPLHENSHDFKRADIQSKQITHLGGAKIKTDTGAFQPITSPQHHKEYIDMVQALLELKIELKQSPKQT